MCIIAVKVGSGEARGQVFSKKGKECSESVSSPAGKRRDVPNQLPNQKTRIAETSPSANWQVTPSP
ncbi:hypothetical protein BAG01nite_40100 [Brevibacillus agri]|uniref:Uncharacterized protein n=1 Tax=Brevibacillus agri TaxID=51101 RepID=A0ABQ0SVS9_9BACL|nr:hypothetical protein [Brevibacillus agri]GED27908.1 hypothetical protein BAG01nite_40100 [Brevibacillus agri]